MKKLSKAILLSLVALLLASMPVLAAVAYRAAYTIVESGGTAYDMLPTMVSVDNQWLADNGFMEVDTLDTRIETLGGAVKPHMVATNKTLTSVPISANSQTNLYFTTANSDLSSLDIITGYDGYITIDDAGDGVTLELGRDFEIEQKGYVDTDAITVSFQAAGVVSEAANGNVTPALPVGWTQGDIWLCLIASLDNVNSTMPAGWTAIDAGTINGANLITSLFWRRAEFGDAAPLVTHAAGNGISAVIVGYSGVISSGSPFDVNQDTYVKTPVSIVNNFGAGITTTIYNDTIVLLSGVGGQTTSITYIGTPTPTERVDAPNTAARPSLVIADFPLVNVGATGARTSTITSFLNNGYQLSLIPIQKNLVYKEDAYRTYIDGATNITSNIWKGNVFPIVADENGGNDVVDRLDHTVNLPANISAGDLLVAFFASDRDIATIITFPGGWIQLFQETGGGVRFGAWYRVADGGEGANIVVTTDVIQMTAHTTYRITGYSGVPEVGAFVQGASNIPDPPNLTPSWGARNTLWFAIMGADKNTTTVVAYPANYTDNQRNDFANNAAGCNVGVASRELNAVSENPGTFTIGAVEAWVANTVAIAPADLEVTALNITSGEYTVKTYGVANEPVWATGDVLHFTGAVDSNINAGDIGDGNKLWISLWFNLDTAVPAGGELPDQYLIGKYTDADEYLHLRIEGTDGKIYLTHNEGLGADLVSTTETAWATGWHHVLASLSTVEGLRLIVDGGTAITDAGGVTPISLTPSDFCIGDKYDGPLANGFKGEIQNVILGIGDLSVDEEADLYDGIAPTGANAPTEYWYIDEGTGTAITSYGSVATTGTADTAPTWQTATFTTGSTGRLCDFYIEVDDGVTDPDRWGANLKGASVAPNGNDWILNQNNVMPYMDYYKHTVGGVEHAWYQPNYMVEATDHDGEEDVGGSDTTITDATMTEAPGYWVGALVTITDSAGAALGESRVCTVFAAGGVITVAPAFSANIALNDDFTIDFGTLIDRSYYGLDFDGVNDRVDCLSVNFPIGNSARTILIWVNPTTQATNEMFFNYGTAVAFQGFNFQTGGVLKERLIVGRYGGNADAESNTNVPTGSWSLIGATLTGSDVAYFLNGQADGTANLAGADTTLNVCKIGEYYWAAAGNYDGLIDEIMLFNRVLGQAEIEYNYNNGVGTYTLYSTEGLVGWWHMEEGSGNSIADSSGEGNTGTINGASWVNGLVPRPAGNSGTNDSRITWGVNPAGVGVTLGGMVSEGQPVPGALPSDPAQDILPETEVTDWYIEPDVTGTLLTNPLRPFVTMWSDNSTLTELQCWRIYALAIILLVTVATTLSVGRHQGITMIAAGAAILGVVVMTIFPMWALVFAIGMFIGGLVMERSPSL